MIHLLNLLKNIGMWLLIFLIIAVGGLLIKGYILAWGWVFNEELHGALRLAIAAVLLSIGLGTAMTIFTEE